MTGDGRGGRKARVLDLQYHPFPSTALLTKHCVLAITCPNLIKLSAMSYHNRNNFAVYKRTNTFLLIHNVHTIIHTNLVSLLNHNIHNNCLVITHQFIEKGHSLY